MKWPKVGIPGTDVNGHEIDIVVSQVGERVALGSGSIQVLLDPSDANMLAEALGAYADDCNPQGENA